MNKSELVSAIADRTGQTKADAEAFLNAFQDVITDEVARKGGKVSLPGFMSVERTVRSARKGRNPQTGEAIDIPASNAIKMSAGSKLKEVAKQS